MAQTTIVPFTSLPSCAVSCGPLYDVNGACVPPAAPTADAAAYGACFCKDARLTALSTGTAAGICDACTATPDNFNSVRNWYTSLCANVGQGVQTTTTTTGGSSGSTGVAGSGGSSNGGNGDWLSTHYKWVIFLVVMVVAIAGIWTGACIWRRHYLRKKDRQYALGKNLAHATEPGRVVPNATNAGSVYVPAAGLFNPAPISSAGIYDTEKPKKPNGKKWVVNERT